MKPIDPHARLLALIAESGNQTKAADTLGISRQMVSFLVNKKATFTPRILEALGLEQVIIETKPR